MGIATFTATVQGPFRIRLTFSEAMNINPAFIDPANYSVVALDGVVIPIDVVDQTGPDNTRGQILLGDGLKPFGRFSVQIGPAVETATGDAVSPNQAVVQWKAVVPSPIRIAFESFSGEVSGGLLGNPAGQVFFSPAFGAGVPNSVIEVSDVSLCTRGYDVYTIPSLPDPVVLVTFPARAGTSAAIGASGGVLRASAYRLGQAVLNLADQREDIMQVPEDGAAEGLLVEPIDITRASFLNDDRWRTFPGATVNVFRTADNLTAIGPGPTIGPFAIP